MNSSSIAAAHPSLPPLVQYLTNEADRIWNLRGKYMNIQVSTLDYRPVLENWKVVMEQKYFKKKRNIIWIF